MAGIENGNNNEPSAVEIARMIEALKEPKNLQQQVETTNVANRAQELAEQQQTLTFVKTPNYNSAFGNLPNRGEIKTGGTKPVENIKNNEEGVGQVVNLLNKMSQPVNPTQSVDLVKLKNTLTGMNKDIRIPISIPTVGSLSRQGIDLPMEGTGTIRVSELRKALNTGPTPIGGAFASNNIPNTHFNRTNAQQYLNNK